MEVLGPITSRTRPSKTKIRRGPGGEASIILHILELEAAMVVVNLGGLFRVRDIRELGLPPITHQYFRPLLCDL